MDTKNVIATLSQNLLDEVKKIMKKEKAEKSEKGESEANEKREHCSEALKGDQHKIDANKNGKVDAHDFHLLRKKKKKVAETYTALKNGEEISEEEVEEAEQIDELSTEKLLAYRKKARAADTIKHDVWADTADEKIKKKTGSYNPNMLQRAKAKLAKEEAEQIDELSKSTLGSYIKKATPSAIHHGIEHGKKKAEQDEVDRITNRHMSFGDKDKIHKALKTTSADVDKPREKALRRNQGIIRATNRLTKEELDQVELTQEEIEQIDEISAGLARRAADKAYDLGAAERRKTRGNDASPLEKKRNIQGRNFDRYANKKEMANEQAEQIDELSTKKLSDYRNKSLSNLEKREKKLKDGLGHGLRMTGSDDEERKIANRVSGIHTSSAKLKAKTGKYNPHPTVGQRIKKALKIEEVELTQEEIDRLDAMMADLEEGRGRPPKEGSEAWKKRQAEGAAAADEPRQHPIQQLERIKRDMRGGGDFLHKDGSTHHLKGGDAAKLLDKYHGLKPAEKEDMQREIHASHAGLKKHL